MHITDDAIGRLIELSTEKQQHIRYYLDGGGCSGFIGRWEFADRINDDDNTIPLHDDKYLLVDALTMKYVIDGTISYDGDFMPILRMTIPNASSCGCGESFQLEP